MINIVNYSQELWCRVDWIADGFMYIGATGSWTLRMCNIVVIGLDFDWVIRDMQK